MKIHRDLAQRSWDWHLLRSGKITASEIENLISPKKFEIKKWSQEGPKTYLERKLDEKWHGGPREALFNGNRQTDQGVFNEPRARSTYQALFDRPVEEIGGIESDDGRCWCSPDGWLCLGDNDAGLEIKCPNGSTHVGYLLGNTLPTEYVLQVYFSLWVSGAQEWHFFSWHREYPHLFIPIRRDPAVMRIIADAVAGFNTKFDAAWAILCDKNGGPPPERKATPPPGFGAVHVESDEENPKHVFDPNGEWMP